MAITATPVLSDGAEGDGPAGFVDHHKREGGFDPAQRCDGDDYGDRKRLRECTGGERRQSPADASTSS